MTTEPPGLVPSWSTRGVPYGTLILKAIDLFSDFTTHAQSAIQLPMFSDIKDGNFVHVFGHKHI